MPPAALGQVELFIDGASVDDPADAAARPDVGPGTNDTPGSSDATVGIPGADQALLARGLVEADRQAVLSAEIAALILETPYDVGDRFDAGDVLVRFDCSLYEAQLGGAQAALSGANSTLANNQQLAAYNSIGQIEVQLARAAVLEAQAEVLIGEVVTERCLLTAPYDGRVLERLAQPHESVEAGQELIQVADDGAIRVTLIVPSLWLSWLAVGADFDFLVDETGRSYPAIIDRLGAHIDPVSQTIEVRGRFVGDADGLILGMSGTATFAESAQ